MSVRVWVPLVMSTLLACSGGSDDPNFGGGGGGGSTGDGGSASDDTGGGDGGSADPDAPSITNVTAEFYTPPQQNTVIEVYVYYDDPQGDVDGGKVQIEVQASGGDAYGDTLNIDGAYARIDDDIEGDPVWFWICGGEDCDGPVDTSQSFELTVELRDAAGHWSEPATATAQ